jgi:DNA-binding MarR family transcriptional regulator
MLAGSTQFRVCLNELSVAVSLAHCTLRGIVDRLEQRGVIERRPDKSDIRISRIYPSLELARFMKQTLHFKVDFPTVR